MDSKVLCKKLIARGLRKLIESLDGRSWQEEGGKEEVGKGEAAKMEAVGKGTRFCYNRASFTC